MSTREKINVEKLEAGRETDALVSERVMGQHVCRCAICVDTGPNGMCENCKKPRGRFYSTHIEKALSLLEHLAETGELAYQIGRSKDKKGAVSFEVSLTGPTRAGVAGPASAPTLALA